MAAAHPIDRPVRMSEMIGRTGSPSMVALDNLYTGVTVDWTRSDYKWYDKLRRGKQPGYELGGLFADPIAAILADWTLGKGVTAATGDEYTDRALNDFIGEVLADLVMWEYNATSLGDSYLGVNTDGTLSAMSPNTVQKKTNRLDYRDTWGYVITTRPDNDLLITDEFWIQPTPYRQLTVKEGDAEIINERYGLLIDQLPIVGNHNKRGTNELYGHPEFEGLRRLFREYDDVIVKSVDGVKIMGHPIPTIEGADDPAQEIENNKTGTTTITLADGSTETIPVIDIAKLFMLVLGGGASFNFKSPGAFTQDAGRMLEYLFLLMLQRARIPEWVWGGAIASSKASVDAQGPAFDLFIRGRQRMIGNKLRELFTIWLKYRSLVDRRIKVLPIKLAWPEILPPDEQRRLDWVKLLVEKGAMSLATALRLSNLVDDPERELAAAQAEQLDRANAEEAAIQAEIERMANTNDNPDETNDDLESEAQAA